MSSKPLPPSEPLSSAKTLSSKPHTQDGRNLKSYYWYWNHEAIIADLEKNRLNFGVLVQNLGNDFNIGTCLRNSNIFGAKEFFYYGRRKFDKRGAVGAQHYEKIKHLADEKALDSISPEYTWVCIDNVPDAVPVDSFEWPERPLMIFGQEREGTDESLLKRASSIVYIKQAGVLPSLNVGTAAGIVMYDYVTKLAKKN